MMKGFFNLKEYSVDDIEKLIQTGAEESLYLEFKSAGALAQNKKNAISKTVSSFANSDGGIVVYGLQEKDHKADNITPINGQKFTKEWLEQVISSNIQRRISGLEIIPIRIANNIEESIYVVKIPASSFAPHMAKDNKFYKRFNYESVPMEEYEVRLLFNREEKTELVIHDPSFRGEEKGKVKESEKFNEGRIYYNLKIENVSNSIEKLYKAEVKFPRVFKLDYQSSIRTPTRRLDDYEFYTYFTGEPLFQGEINNFGNGPTISIKKSKLDQLDKELNIKLYYSNGVIEKKWTIQELVDNTNLKLYELR